VYGIYRILRSFSAPILYRTRNVPVERVDGTGNVYRTVYRISVTWYSRTGITKVPTGYTTVNAGTARYRYTIRLLSLYRYYRTRYFSYRTVRVPVERESNENLLYRCIRACIAVRYQVPVVPYGTYGTCNIKEIENKKTKNQTTHKQKK
jgi:hypothetical protein